MIIIVNLKSSWGKDFFYPASDDAHWICQLTGRPTIIKRQLELLKKRGFTVIVTNETLQKHNEDLMKYE